MRVVKPAPLSSQCGPQTSTSAPAANPPILVLPLPALPARQLEHSQAQPGQSQATHRAQAAGLCRQLRQGRGAAPPLLLVATLAQGSLLGAQPGLQVRQPALGVLQLRAGAAAIKPASLHAHATRCSGPHPLPLLPDHLPPAPTALFPKPQTHTSATLSTLPQHTACLPSLPQSPLAPCAPCLTCSSPALTTHASSAAPN